MQKNSEPLVIRQKKRGDKAAFTFQESSLQYDLKDSSGTEVRLSVPYAQLPGKFYHQTWQPKGYIVRLISFIVVMLILSRLVREIEKAEEILLVGLLIGGVFIALALLFDPLMKRSYIRIPIAGQGNLLLLRDKKRQSVLDELDKRRMAALRQQLAVIDTSNNPMFELQKFKWLVQEKVITKAEYDVFCQRLNVEGEAAALPELPPEASIPPVLFRQWQPGQRSIFKFHHDYLEYQGAEEGFNAYYNEIAPPEKYNTFRESSWLAAAPFFAVVAGAGIWLAFDRNNHNWIGPEGAKRFFTMLAVVIPLLTAAYYLGKHFFRNSSVLVPTESGVVTVLDTSQKEKILQEIAKRREAILVTSEFEDEASEQAAARTIALRYIEELHAMGVLTEEENEMLTDRVSSSGEIEFAEKNPAKGKLH